MTICHEKQCTVPQGVSVAYKPVHMTNVDEALAKILEMVLLVEKIATIPRSCFVTCGELLATGKHYIIESHKK